jgi:hypothetical protein
MGASVSTRVSVYGLPRLTPLPVRRPLATVARR